MQEEMFERTLLCSPGRILFETAVHSRNRLETARLAIPPKEIMQHKS